MNLYHTIKDKIGKDSKYEEGEIITFLNPYSYLVARKHVELFSKFDRIYIDGMALLILFRMTGQKNLKRFSFDYTSIGRDVLESLHTSGQSVYILGTTEQNIEKAIANITGLFPNINLVGFRNGYFSDANELSAIISEITSVNPSYVIAGMGTPFQENFLVKLKEAGWNGTGFTCGGFLHQSAKNVVYYPDWVNKLNIRWMYRIWDEPKLVKRYFFFYPIAFLRILFDTLRPPIK